MAISPGRSWYQDTSKRTEYPRLEQETECDVCVVGGGFCGVATALNLTEQGIKVTLLEQERIGDGASGRNGGQLGSGQNVWVTELEKRIGFENTKRLWDIAQNSKRSLLETADKYGFEIDYINGQLTPAHHKRYEKSIRAEVDALNQKYGYEDIQFIDKEEMAEALGSSQYYGGIKDDGTGHIHPLKYVVGLTKAAETAGVGVFEKSKVVEIGENSNRYVVVTEGGRVRADNVVLALNGYHGDINRQYSRYLMPLKSYIAATAPLDPKLGVLPHKHAVDDTRNNVRYWRMTKDDRLLFGGRDVRGGSTQEQIMKTIRRIMVDVYPQLQDVELTHAWGGDLAITRTRMPYVSEPKNGMWVVGGFSGHGVMLANYTGKLIAQKIAGVSDDIDAIREMSHSIFPGGKWVRAPSRMAAMVYYSIVDKL